jgi:hypothetical protein
VHVTGKHWVSLNLKEDVKMTTNKFVPVVALAVLMGLSGAMIATAQGLEAPGAEEAVTPVECAGTGAGARCSGHCLPRRMRMVIGR